MRELIHLSVDLGKYSISICVRVGFKSATSVSAGVLCLCCLCPLTVLAHYGTSFVSPAGSLQRVGALKSKGFSRPASPGQSS